MSPEEIEELWAEHAARPGEVTLDALVRLYAPLARYLASRALAKAPPWQDRDEILSFANDGLLDAIRKFEPGRGLKFETYATRRIGGAIIDWQRRMDPLTRSERGRVKDLEAAQVVLEHELGHEPNATELAAHMEIDEDEVRQRLVTQRTLQGSLDAMLTDDDEGGEFKNLESDLGLVYEDDAEVNSRMHEARLTLASRLPRLDDVERAFVLLYYCDNMTLREVGVATGEHEVLSGRLKTRVLRDLATS